jgi:small multidrug resistance pump
MNIISGYVYLILAIIFGILSSGYLKTTENFTNLMPTIFCILTIISCIFCLSKTMNILPVGFAYASYGGLTITGVTLFAVFKYNQIPNIYGILGMLFIIVGVVLLNTLAKAN